MAQLEGRLSEIARGQSDLTRRLDRLFEQGLPSPAEAPSASGAARTEGPGFDALRQAFYHRLENKYRGSLEDIRRKLRVHLPEIEAAFLRTGEDKPVLDLGCGRGEWLELLKSLGIPAQGVDTNAYQIEQARADGLDVVLADAIATLEQAPDDSLAAITAFHLIEHVPFDTVLWIAREAMRVLAPGGVLLFETPNVRNVLVGATSFHNDPTHLAPRTDAVMSVVFETCGFEAIDTRFLNAHERLEEFAQKLEDELAYLLFGAQDLAISGRKPLGGA
jgi:O-antigen chain-terminating methyltransferase